MSAEDTIREENPDEWLPASGPLEWEGRTESVEGQQEEGRCLAVRDAFNPDAFIISTVYAPDLNRML